MTKVQQITEWQSLVEYSPAGPKHHVLADTGSYRAVLVGIDAGGEIPSHPSTDATYHFLDGSGWMIVDGERYPVSAGSTMVVPAKAKRGIEAETRLAFLGSHGGHGKGSHGQAAKHHHVHDSTPNRRPLVLFGLMALSMLVVMLGLWQIGANPMAMMFSGFGRLGLGAWGAMLIPMLGLVGMGVMMFVMYRNMSKMNTGMQRHDHASLMSSAKPRQAMDSTQRVTFSVPSVSCGGCKQTIEQKIGQVDGVSAVEVDIDAKQAVIAYGPPATDAGLAKAMEEIGYPVAAE